MKNQKKEKAIVKKLKLYISFLTKCLYLTN